MQVPPMSSEAVVAPAATAQTVGVVDAKATVKPEEAVAERLRLGTPVCGPGLGKVMVWCAGLTQNAWETAGAGP